MMVSPSVSRAHEWERPRAILVAVDISDTLAGVVRCVAVRPSWPLSLLPQHMMLPACRPSAGRTVGVTQSDTRRPRGPGHFDGDGTVRTAPVPELAEEVVSQHMIAPLVSRRTSGSCPERYCRRRDPGHGEGVVRRVVVPSPSWPLSLLPQHVMAPPVSRAHEWESPRAILFAVEILNTSTGVELWVVVPFPSWPLTLLPQHLIAPPIGRAHRSSAQSDGCCRRDPRHFDGGGTVRSGPVTELAVGVPTPALDRAAHYQGARVEAAQSEARPFGGGSQHEDGEEQEDRWVSERERHGVGRRVAASLSRLPRAGVMTAGSRQKRTS